MPTPTDGRAQSQESHRMFINVPSLVLAFLGTFVGLLGMVAAGSVGVAALGLLAVCAAWLIHSQDRQVASR